MRKVTKNIIGVLSLGVLATSWSLGQAAETGLVISNSAANGTATTGSGATAGGDTSSATPSDTATPTQSATPTNSAQSSTSASSSAAGSTSSSKSSSAAATPTPTASQKAASSSNSATGSAVAYKYGTMQVEVVKSGSTITAVNLIQSSTRGQEYAVVPGMLVDAAVAANGSGFGNVSGATFTTTAFKQALESALAKF